MNEIPGAVEVLKQARNIESPPNFKMGKVSALFANSTAKVSFDGEGAASEKQYSYLSSYKPVVNDRVLMAYVSGTYIILGKINFEVTPGLGATTINGTLTVNGLLSVPSAGDFQLGSTCRVGFFGTSMTSKTSVSDPSAITATGTADTTYSSNEVTLINSLKTDVTNLRTTVLNLCNALQSYGLV